MGINARQLKAAVKLMHASNDHTGSGVGDNKDIFASTRYDAETGAEITDFSAVVEADDLKMEALQGDDALVNMLNKFV